MPENQQFLMRKFAIFFTTAGGFVYITSLGRLITYNLPSHILKMSKVKVDNNFYKAVKYSIS